MAILVTRHSGIPQAFVMVIKIAHDDGMFAPLEGHPVLFVHTGFEYVRNTLHPTCMKSRMMEILLKETKGLVYLTL